MPLRINRPVIGQIVLFRAYNTMTIFCGFDHSRNKSVLLWSESQGKRWITKKWFLSRYSILVYEDNKIERDEMKKVFRGLLVSSDVDLEPFLSERDFHGRHFEESILRDKMMKDVFRRTLEDARTRYDAGEIIIPTETFPCISGVYCCILLVLVSVAVFMLDFLDLF